MAVAAEPVHVRIRVRVSMGAGAQDDVEVLVAVEVAEGDVRRLLSAGFDARDSRAWRLPTDSRTPDARGERVRPERAVVRESGRG